MEMWHNKNVVEGNEWKSIHPSQAALPQQTSPSCRSWTERRVEDSAGSFRSSLRIRDHFWSPWYFRWHLVFPKRRQRKCLQTLALLNPSSPLATLSVHQEAFGCFCRSSALLDTHWKLLQDRWDSATQSPSCCIPVVGLEKWADV